MKKERVRKPENFQFQYLTHKWRPFMRPDALPLLAITEAFLQANPGVKWTKLCDIAFANLFRADPVCDAILNSALLTLRPDWNWMPDYIKARDKEFRNINKTR